MTHSLFDDRARSYARIRPTYPDRLFDHLATLASGHDVVWDCGAGSGQASRSLAERFDRVVATDISRAQLGHLVGGPRIHAVVAAAESAPLRDHSVDLITVSAALHWFDRPRFYTEARRVARPGGVIAVWSYFRAAITPEVETVVNHYADEIVSEYWQPTFELNRRMYRELEFPFEPLPWLELNAEAHMRLDDLLEFMRTWSASQTWSRQHGGADPVDLVRAELERAWGDPAHVRVVRWPLHGAIGRIA
jgi:ubiquinone/menaquinone biosynthesis C-methylase UbiE